MVCPLDLPEMLLYIAPFLSKRALVSAILVSRQWHRSFTPFLYKSFMVQGNWSESDSFPPLAVLEKNASSVRFLYLYTIDGLSPFLQQCTNLKTLAIYAEVFSKQEPKEIWTELTSLVQQNPLIEWVMFGLDLKTSPSFEFLNALDQFCPNLKRYESSRGTYENRDQAEALLQVMTRIEQVSARYEYFINVPKIDRWVFPKLWELTLKDVRGLSTQSQVDLMCQCPNLKILKWTVSRESHFPVDEFCERVPVACPNITHFHTDGYSVPDPKDLARILASLDRLVFLILCANRISRAVFQSLGQHFSTLETLDVIDCFGVKSWMVQQVLESCPNLIKLRTSNLRMSHIVHGKSWAATRLRYLEAELQPTLSSSSSWTKESSNNSIEEHWTTFRQLSKMTQLQKLIIGTQGMTPKAGIMFRLESGLDQLSTLTQLKELSLSRSYQRMSFEDIAWIMDHLSDLQKIEGIFSPDWEKHMEISERFRAFGIEVPEQDRFEIQEEQDCEAEVIGEEEEEEEDDDDYDDYEYYDEEDEEELPSMEVDSSGPLSGEQDGMVFVQSSVGAGPIQVEVGGAENVEQQ